MDRTTVYMGHPMARTDNIFPERSIKYISELFWKSFSVIVSILLHTLNPPYNETLVFRVFFQNCILVRIVNHRTLNC